MSTFKVSCGFSFKNSKAVDATISDVATALASTSIVSINVDGYPEPDGGMKKYYCEIVAQFTADTIAACATAAKTALAAVGADNDIDCLTIDTLTALPTHTHTKSEITDFTHTHVVDDVTDFPTLATVATSGLSADLTDIASEVTEEGTTAVTSAGIYAALHPATE